MDRDDLPPLPGLGMCHGQYSALRWPSKPRDHSGGADEQIRSVLVTVKNKASKDRDSAQQRVIENEKILAALFDKKEFSQSEALKKINELRAVLKAPPIKSMESFELKSGITPSATVVNPQGVNVSLFETDVTNLLALRDDKNKNPVLEAITSLINSLEKVKEDQKSYSELRCYNLVETGMALIPENGECPLCNKDWETGKLKIYLEQRIRKT